MLNNYLAHEYHPSDVVFTHDSGHALHLGDISAALDGDFIKREAITTGPSTPTQSSRLPPEWTRCSSIPQSRTSSTRSSTPKPRTSRATSRSSTFSPTANSPAGTFWFTALPASHGYASPHAVLHPRHCLPHAQETVDLPRDHRLRQEGKAQCTPQSRLRKAAQGLRGRAQPAGRERV